MTPQGRLVLVESPFKGRTSSGLSYNQAPSDLTFNKRYVLALCRHIAMTGDNPFASHVFCTQFLDDTQPNERACGIAIGLAWGQHANATFVGIDRGISEGMELGIKNARDSHRPITWISLSDFTLSWIPEGVDREGWKRFYQDHDQLLFLSNGETK